MSLHKNGFLHADTQAEIRQDKKVHWTVTPIKDISAWKAEQKRLNEVYEAGREERYKNAKAGALRALDGGQRSEAIVQLEQLEQAYIESRRDAKKPPKITKERADYLYNKWDSRNEVAKIASKVDMLGLLMPEQEPKPSLYQRFKAYIAKFCKDAFYNS